MRIILVWPSSSPHTKVLFEKLRAAGHEVVYWVGEFPVEHLTPEGAIFHDHYHAWDGIPAKKMKAAHIEPPPLDLIEKMYRTESLVLTMMNKRYDSASVDERKHIYYSMLGYWQHVLNVTRAEAVIFSIIPHTVYNLIIHELASQRGIPTITFEDTWVALRLLWFTDFWKGSEKLKNILQREERVDLDDLQPEMQAYLRDHADKQEAPSYMIDQKNLAEGLGLFRHRLRIASSNLLNGRFFSITAAYLKRRIKKNLRHEYEECVTEPSFERPFVYFPLNFQPERTTSPQGDAFHDQVLVAETLAAALPDDWEIYIKEHPSQWWLRGKERYSSARYPGYYRRLAHIPRVKLVPTTTSSFKLQSKAKAVATVTGTAGWEALLAGKTPLIFGIPWYRDCPGIFMVRSAEDCRAAFKRIADGSSVSRAQIIRFLRALEIASLRAHAGEPPSDSPKTDPVENMEIVSNKILELLSPYSEK